MAETLILEVLLVLPVWMAASILEVIVNIGSGLPHGRPILPVDHEVLIFGCLQLEFRVRLRRLRNVLSIEALLLRFQIYVVLSCYVSC